MPNLRSVSQSVVMGMVVRTRHRRSAEGGWDLATLAWTVRTLRGGEIARVQAGVGYGNDFG